MLSSFVTTGLEAGGGRARVPGDRHWNVDRLVVELDSLAVRGDAHGSIDGVPTTRRPLFVFHDERSGGGADLESAPTNEACFRLRKPPIGVFLHIL
jgi:hypothetical protein